jgi:hypothetical protein
MEKVSISKDLLHAILHLAYDDGFGVGGSREDFTDDSPEAQILDCLAEEFTDEQIEELFPGEFLFGDEATEKAEFDDLGSSLTKENLEKAEEYKANVQKSSR